MKKALALFMVLALFMALLVLLPAVHAISATALASDDDGLPSEWLGKKKVVDNFEKYTRVVIIHYTSSDASRDVNYVVDIGDPDNDGYKDGYQLSGVWWNLSKYPNGVPYIINPSGGVKQGLREDSIIYEIKAALETWDLAVDLSDSNVTLTYESGVSTTYNVALFGDEPSIDYKAKASIASPDYKNVITWGRAQPGVVAYAVIWYISSTGEIVDADIVLNSYYKWGIADGNEGTRDLANKFDLRNVVIHEAGHWVGLDDIYDSNYSAMTMYGYTSYGEEIKRSLEPGDITGAQYIYSAWRSN